MIIKDYRGGGRKNVSFDISDECDGWNVYPYLLNKKKAIARHVIKEAKEVRRNSVEYRADPYTFVMFDTAGDYSGPMPEKPVLFRASPCPEYPNQFAFPYPLSIPNPRETKRPKILVSFCGAYTSKVRGKQCEGLKRILGKEFYLVKRAKFFSGCPHEKEEFERLLAFSKFTFAPQGYGISAKRMYFAMAYGSIPVVPEVTPLPFYNLIAWHNLAVIYKNAKDAADQMKAMNEEEVQDRSRKCQECFRTMLSKEVVLRSVAEELRMMRAYGQIQ